MRSPLKFSSRRWCFRCRFPVRLNATLCSMLMLLAGPAAAVLGQEPIDRSQRSPWRASFNQVSPQAVDAIQSNADRAPVNANPVQANPVQGNPFQNNSANPGPPNWAAVDPRSTASPSPYQGTGTSGRLNDPFGQTGPPRQGFSPADTAPRLDAANANATLPPSPPSGSTAAASESNSLAGSRSNLDASHGSMETKVTRTQNQLPNDAGQVWREYDITPYTDQVKSVQQPQQAILDWVLRETGTEMWFNQPLGILHATEDRLIVYHTPEIQAVVKSITDRFVRTRGQVQNFNVDLLTVGNPNWRANAYSLLQTIDVQTPGVEAWMMSKENAAILIGQLRQRSDFKQHSGGEVKNHDGQSFVLEKTKPVPFVRSIRWLPGQFPGFEPLLTTINEGYTLSISSLSLLDNRAIEVAIKCDVDQVETLTPIKIPVGVGNAVQSADINVPELISWRLHERFRWPSDQVLLLSCGVVADPQPETSGGKGVFGLGVGRRRANRSDALLLIEYRGPASEANLPRTAGRSSLAPLK